MRIVITGAGVVSAIGIGKEETLRSLLEGRSGIGKVHYLHTSHPEFPVGEVKLTDAQMRARLGIGPDAVQTRTAMMGIMALREAAAEAALTEDLLRDAVLLNGTTVGGMEKSEAYYHDFISEKDAHTEYIGVHDCGASTELIADAIGGFREATTLSTACSSALNAILLGAELLRSGRAEVVAAGGSECLSDFHLNGFNSLMILDPAPCRPFDATRSGLNLGEGAAFLILETEEHALKRGVQALASLDGWGNACDAFHQTASSEDGEGAFLSMQEALRIAGLRPSDIDYINAHGTGTPNNDPSESAALRRIFGQAVPPVSSTKGFTGHTTSASGSIEAVFCLLALQNGFIPANYGFSEPDPACITPSRGETGVPLRHILCNAFGFGGNDSSILLSRL